MKCTLTASLKSLLRRRKETSAVRFTEIFILLQIKLERSKVLMVRCVLKFLNTHPTQPKASTFTQHADICSLCDVSLIKETKMFNMPPHLKFC